jgi:hypothetical protein|tara:strand:+ start:1546 stop:2826 length:1281 start_codon:yes stop_codon:yes gene_type:complete
MNRRINIVFVFFMLGACDTTDKDVVASINDIHITSQDVYALSPLEKFSKLDHPDKRSIMNKALAYNWLQKQTQILKIDTLPEIDLQVQRYYERILVDDFVQRSVWKKVLSDSAMYSTYHKLHKSVLISQVLIQFEGGRNAKSTRTLQQAKKRAYNLWNRVKSGTMTFDEVAFSFSDDPVMKKSKGNMGKIFWGTMNYEVLGVIWDPECPPYPKPILSDMGYHLIWKRGEIGVPQEPFDKIKGEVRKLIKSGKTPEYKMALTNLENTLLTTYEVMLDTMAIYQLFDISTKYLDRVQGRLYQIMDNINYNEPLAYKENTPLDLSWFKNRININPLFNESIINRKFDLFQTLKEIIVRHLAYLEAKKNKYINDLVSKAELDSVRSIRSMEYYKTLLINKESTLTEDILINRIIFQNEIYIDPMFITNQE